MITYNHARFIKQAIESVLMQKAVFPYELVIGEDCSTDGTREIVIGFQQQNPERIRLLLPELNLGMNANFIRTLQACRGQYVALIEGDDYWTSIYKLQKQAEFLDTHSDCSFCFHTVHVVLDTEDQAPRLVAPRVSKEVFTLEDLLVSNFIQTASVMFRNRPAAEFLQRFEGIRMMDWQLHIFNAQFGKIGFINESMGVYRLHAGGAWSPKDLVWQNLESVRVLEEVNAQLDYRYDRVIKRSISLYHLRLALVWAGMGYAARAKSYARTCTAESWRHAKLPATSLVVMWLAVCFCGLSRLILSVKAFSTFARRILLLGLL